MKKYIISLTLILVASATSFSAYFGGDLKKSEGIPTKTATFNISSSMGSNFVCIAEARGTHTSALMYGYSHRYGTGPLASAVGTTATETVRGWMNWNTSECPLNYAKYTLKIKSTASADAHCNAGFIVW